VSWLPFACIAVLIAALTFWCAGLTKDFSDLKTRIEKLERKP
jgi:hypothetical protein